MFRPTRHLAVQSILTASEISVLSAACGESHRALSHYSVPKPTSCMNQEHPCRRRGVNCSAGSLCSCMSKSTTSTSRPKTRRKSTTLITTCCYKHSQGRGSGRLLHLRRQVRSSIHPALCLLSIVFSVLHYARTPRRGWIGSTPSLARPRGAWVS